MNKVETYSKDFAGNPLCPACGASMVRRTAMKGTHSGERFWGCSKYPKCNRIIKINNEEKIDVKTVPLVKEKDVDVLYRPDISSLSDDKITECPFDGQHYKKGSLCPNYKNHQAVNNHRRKGKSGELFGRIKHGM